MHLLRFPWLHIDSRRCCRKPSRKSCFTPRKMPSEVLISIDVTNRLLSMIGLFAKVSYRLIDFTRSEKVDETSVFFFQCCSDKLSTGD